MRRFVNNPCHNPSSLNLLNLAKCLTFSVLILSLVHSGEQSETSLFQDGKVYRIISSAEPEKVLTNRYLSSSEDAKSSDLITKIKGNSRLGVVLDSFYPGNRNFPSDKKMHERQEWLAVYTGRSSTPLGKENGVQQRQFLLIPKNQITPELGESIKRKRENGEVIEKPVNKSLSTDFKGMRVLTLDASGNLTLQELKNDPNEADSSQRWISEEIPEPESILDTPLVFSARDPLHILRRGFFAFQQRVGGLRNIFIPPDEKEEEKHNHLIRIKNVGNDQCIRNFEYYNKQRRVGININPNNLLIGNRVFSEFRKRIQSIQNIFSPDANSPSSQTAEERVLEEENKEVHHTLGTVDCSNQDISQKWITKQL